MKVLGRTNTRILQVISQDEPFIMNEYLIVEDVFHDLIPVEVVKTEAYPMAVQSVLPEGTDVEFINVLNIKKDKPLYIAKVTVLQNLTTPVTPASHVRKPEFNEVRKILVHSEPNNGLTLGVIEGTTQLQKDLPVELSNIAPGWKDYKAIKQNGVPFIIPYNKFREYPHIGIFGTTGSGKTFGMRVFEEELMKFNIPTLMFDPHNESTFNEEMDGLTEEQKVDYKNKHVVFYIGKDVGINFCELDLGELVHLFEYVGALTEPQKAALEELYEKGDTLANLKRKITLLKTAFEIKESRDKDKPTMNQEQAEIFFKLGNSISGSSTLQALSWKLDSLENTNIFNGNIKGVEKALKQRKMVVVRGDIKRLQMISSYMIKKFYKKRRKYQDSSEQGIESEYFPMFFIVMDESHNFAPKARRTPTGSTLTTIALEARKYGVFLIMVTQKPDALDERIVAQLNTKVIYRLSTAEEMELVKKETNLTEEEVQKLPSLPSGSCFVSTPILPKTFSVKFRTTFTKSPNTRNPFDELDKFSITKDLKQLESFLMNNLPIHLGKMPALHNKVVQEYGMEFEVSDISELLKTMALNGNIIEKKTPMGLMYQKD